MKQSYSQKSEAGSRGESTKPPHESFPEVSFVLPCLNEAFTVQSCIRKIRQVVEEHHIDAEIIVADNGSADGSDKLAVRAGAKVIHVREKGYGAAVSAGISAAGGNFIIMGDADDSYDFSASFPFIGKLREGFDLVMGSRFPKGGGKIMPGAMPWLHRWIGNPALTGIGRLLFPTAVTDFHCGMRAFRRDLVDRINLQSTGMEFASEMVVKATFVGARITEVPITLHKDGRDRPSHLRSWRDGWRHLRFMLLYSPRWLFLIPGMFLLVAGSVVGGLLIAGPVHVGRVTFDTNTLLVAAMAVLVGFNLIAFSIFSKIFAISAKLLPKDPFLEKLQRFFSLEIGIGIGAVFTVVGVILLIVGVLYWQRYDFGPLSYPDSLRLVIPGTTALTLGIEIVFSSFFLSILSMPRR